MADIKLYLRCEQCKGVGSYTPQGGETITCGSCNGSGKYEQQHFNIDELESKLDSIIAE